MNLKYMHLHGTNFTIITKKRFFSLNNKFFVHSKVFYALQQKFIFTTAVVINKLILCFLRFINNYLKYNNHCLYKHTKTMSGNNHTVYFEAEQSIID